MGTPDPSKSILSVTVELTLVWSDGEAATASHSDPDFFPDFMIESFITLKLSLFFGSRQMPLSYAFFSEHGKQPHACETPWNRLETVHLVGICLFVSQPPFPLDWFLVNDRLELDTSKGSLTMNTIYSHWSHYQ